MRKATSNHMQNGATQKFDASSSQVGHTLASLKQTKRNRKANARTVSELERKLQMQQESKANSLAWANSSATLMAGFDKKYARKHQ